MTSKSGESGAAGAVRWVELLLQPAISEELLVEAASHLCQCHYQDVVDERNIEGLCGYPCCGRRLGVVTQQKYHISVQRKLVLDLTERKKFCRADCYKASKYYARQLSTLSLWSRECRHTSIKLLPLTVPPPSTPPTEHPPPSTPPTKHPPPSTPPLEHPPPSTPPTKHPPPSTPPTEHPPPSTPGFEDGGGKMMEERGHLPNLSSVDKILHAFNSWCTPTTWEQLQSGRAVVPHTSMAPPFPGDTTPSAAYLSPVHRVAQNQLQRTIFWQQARKSLAAVAGELGLSVPEVQSSLATLLKTFQLDRHTVVFRPAEWRVILLVLLQRLYPDCTRPQGLEIWLTAVGASLDDLALMSATLESPKSNLQQAQLVPRDPE